MNRLPVRLIVAALLAAALTSCTPPWSGGEEAAAPAVEGQFPQVQGQWGKEPQISAGSGEAPRHGWEKRVVREGDGPVVGDNYFALIDYKVQTWAGKAQTSSFGLARSTLGVPLVGKSLPQPWAEAVLGQRVGSRIELVISEEKQAELRQQRLAENGGQESKSEAKLARATAPLVYVIDIRAAASLTQDSALTSENSTCAAANYAKLPSGIQIDGEIDQAPQIRIAPDTGPVLRPQVLMLWQGKGPSLQSVDFPLVRITARSFKDGQWGEQTSSWSDNLAYPTLDPVGSSEVFLGVPVGSRMVQLLPAQPATQGSPAQDAQIVVYDVVGAVNSQG